RPDQNGWNTHGAEYLAKHIPGARLVRLSPSEDVPPYLGDTDETVKEVEKIVRSLRREQEDFDRFLTTVLFTDIVGSAARAAELGNGEWRRLLERHHATVRMLLGRYRGKEIDNAGDGFFAHFDGPGRAIKCALAIEDSVKALGLDVRAGVHTGECEVIDGKPGGLSAVVGARIGGIAGAGEVLVSQTVRDLAGGSGLRFEDAGEHELKGVPDHWRLYRVVNELG
ncbi:MAG: adenylate/guanylate cyclase domain-containing protein, partial [Actinomycetota bacterium]